MGRGEIWRAGNDRRTKFVRRVEYVRRAGNDRRRSPPVYRGRGPRNGEGVQKQRYENLGKWVYILVSDCGEVVKNTHSMQTTH